MDHLSRGGMILKRKELTCNTSLTESVQYDTKTETVKFVTSSLCCLVTGVLGELGPGQLGPGQLGPGLLGPGQLGPGAQLSGAQLSGAQLSGAQLSGAQFA